MRLLEGQGERWGLIWGEEKVETGHLVLETSAQFPINSQANDYEKISLNSPHICGEMMVNQGGCRGLTGSAILVVNVKGTMNYSDTTEVASTGLLMFRS
jgi:hypothetical protein